MEENDYLLKGFGASENKLSASEHLLSIITDLVKTLNVPPADLKHLQVIYDLLKLLQRNEEIFKNKSLVFIVFCENLVDRCLEIVLSKNLEPNVEHLVFNILETCIECSYIKKCLVLLNKIESNLSDNKPSIQSENKITTNLYVLETVLKVIPEKFISSEFVVNEEIVYKLNSTTFCNTLIDLVFSTNKVVRSTVLLSIFPKILNIIKTNSILNYMWEHISSKRLELNEQLFCLCSLSNFFLTNERKSLYLVEENNFWRIIQIGLVDSDPLLKKEALYLLKRAVDVADEKNVTVNTELFIWKSSDKITLKETWELVFIILEVLEEKQAHLVTPIFSSVLKIQDVCKQSSENINLLHPSWLLCIYNRILKHDSSQVMKWGVIHFLKIGTNIYEETQYELTLHTFLETINNMSLFAKTPDKLLEPSETECELKKWFVCISNCENYEFIFRSILTATNKINWSPVPLFHFLNCFSSIVGVKVWNDSCLNIIKAFAGEALTTQTIYIRGAIQCTLIRILINLSDINSISINVVMNTLNAFRQNESLCRGTETWSIVVDWLRMFVTVKDAENFIKDQLLNKDLNELSSESLARSLVLLFDAGLILNKNDTDIIFNLLSEHFECLARAGLRLYSCAKTQDECLKLIKNILLELRLKNNNIGLEKNTFEYFSDLLKEPIVSIIPYIRRRLIAITEISDYYSIELYIELLNCLIDSRLISKTICEDIVTLQTKAFEISTRFVDENDPAIKHFFSLQILNWSAKYVLFGKNIPKSMIEIIVNFVEHTVINNRLNIILYKVKRDENLTRNFQVLWGRLASGSIQAVWSILSNYFKIVPPSEKELIFDPKDFCFQSLEAIQIGGRLVIIYVLDVLRTILPKLLRSSKIDTELPIKLIESSWNACFELRKMDLFWEAFKKWIVMFFQKDIIAFRHIKGNILQYSEQILSQGDSITGLCNVFVIHLQRQSIDLDGLYLLKDVLVSLLMFGSLQRRDQRIENDTIEYIGSLGSRCSINELASESNKPRNDSTVRLCALDIILKAVCNDKERGQHLVRALIDQLLDKEREMTDRKPRYYGDSLHHRAKNRILQSLLVLESVLAENESDLAQKYIADLHQWTYTSLKGESQQPSIRYQLEWLFIRTFLHSPAVQNDFWIKFEQASKERIGSLCSFISIAYHLAVLMQDDNFIDQSILHILPGCMGQNFNVQLYAQTVLEKLLKLSPAVNLRYKFLEKCIPTNLAQGNAARNAAKLKKDFYFTVFHPVKHFSLQTIFLELPRLSNLTSEEWILLPVLNATFIDNYSSIPITNLDSDLSIFQAASWIVKATESSGNSVDASGVQKKFVPWKGMSPECDIVSNDHRKSANDGLIVVAPLIDKVPNLGGLSRTCEIFAVSSLVLGSLEYVQNKEFSVLSMSAEKHIQITEVKPYNLAEYLCLMKKTGYTVVGAEQTAGSESLGEFKFPKKCLLLLGNEKEGIPVNLIHLLDKCVEIPQYGVVRSLNVHVTGALFIWEYTKQHQS